jgi:hypothetical protein
MFLNRLEFLMSLLPNVVAASLSAGRKIFWGGSTHFCRAIILNAIHPAGFDVRHVMWGEKK